MEGEATMFRNKEQNMEEEQGGKYKGNDIQGESKKKSPTVCAFTSIFKLLTR